MIFRWTEQVYKMVQRIPIQHHLLLNGQIVDVVVTDGNGCINTSSGITNTVFALPNPTLSSSDADNIICEGNSVTFTAGGGASYNFRVDDISQQNTSIQ